MDLHRSRSVTVSCSFILALALSGSACTTSGDDHGAGGAGATTAATGGSGGAGGGAECAAGGTGTLAVTVTGLPADVAADVTVTGPDGDTAHAKSDMKSDAPAGSYTVAAGVVTTPDPIVRAAYAPTVDTDAFCLDDGGTQSVGVTYAAIPSSHKLWFTNETGGAGALLGFDAASLAVSGDVAATVKVQAGAGRDITFDRDGNLWSMGATVADAMLLRYPASSLGTSGKPAPDREINFDAGGCSPATRGMAFDPQGNLWVTSPCTKSIVRFTGDDLAASGDVVPLVTIGGFGNLAGIAFDSDGNLWAADEDVGLLRYDASRLGAAVTGAADRTITLKSSGSAGYVPSWLAFDASGNLWTNDFAANVVLPVGPADLAGTGNATVIPKVEITIGVAALLESMAFDDSGGLWMAGSAGKIIRLAPAQLTMTTNAGDPTVPETVVSSPDMGYAVNLAFFPAPAGLPLYHALP